MKLETLTYTSARGWSSDLPAQLDSDQTLVLAFCAPEYFDNPAPISELAQAFPKAHLAGCSTAGEIYESTVRDQSLSVAIAKFEHTTLKSATATVHSSNESFIAGETIAKTLLAPDLHGIFLLSDGSKINGSDLIRGVNSLVSAEVVVTGGLAGDGDRFQRTWSMASEKPQTGLVVAIGFYGDRILIGHGCKGGWDAFGLQRQVTRSDGNILYELDGKPALELYKRYLGDQAAGLPSTGLLFPLALRADSSDEKHIVRTILQVDEASQSLIFAGDVPEGYHAQLMKANFDRLVAGASWAASHAASLPDRAGDSLSIAISCVGRRLVLGEHTDDELEATMEVLPHATQQIGFYSYGEISPFTTGYCDLHNQTMTLTTLSERDSA